MKKTSQLSFPHTISLCNIPPRDSKIIVHSVFLYFWNPQTGPWKCNQKINKGSSGLDFSGVLDNAGAVCCKEEASRPWDIPLTVDQRLFTVFQTDRMWRQHEMKLDVFDCLVDIPFDVIQSGKTLICRDLYWWNNEFVTWHRWWLIFAIPALFLQKQIFSTDILLIFLLLQVVKCSIPCENVSSN